MTVDAVSVFHCLSVFDSEQERGGRNQIKRTSERKSEREEQYSYIYRVEYNVLEFDMNEILHWPLTIERFKMPS